MPNRISASAGDHSCFLTFVTMIRIDCKITHFPYTFKNCLMFRGTHPSQTHTHTKLRTSYGPLKLCLLGKKTKPLKQNHIVR